MALTVNELKVDFYVSDYDKNNSDYSLNILV